VPRVRPLLPLVWLLVALLSAGCAAGQDGAAPAAGNGQRYVSGGGSATVVPAASRVAAPALRAPLLDGGTWSLADQRGKVVVLNVWASWCAPCRAEAPLLERVAQETAPAGVSFVGINTRDDPQSAAAFLRSFGVTYPSLRDPDGTLVLAFNGTVPPSAVPSTVVVDRQGRIAAVAVGAVTYRTLRGLVDAVAAEAG